MGINRLIKLLIEDLSRSFTTQELGKFCDLIERNFNLYRLTGYPDSTVIPKIEAATVVVEYFNKSDKLVLLLNGYFQASLHGFKGEKVVFNNFKQIVQEMHDTGYQFNQEMDRVVIIEKNIKRNDWGILEEGLFYDFCFVSVDICGNTKLARKYDTELIQKTFLEFMKLIAGIIIKRDGRIWIWEGDGGLLVFHLNDFVNQAIYSSIDILGSIPVFNLTKSFIDENIEIRIGLNVGKTEYKKDNRTIQSDAIKEVKILEKEHTVPMTISITSKTFQHIDPNIKKFLVKKEIKNKVVYQLRLPLLGEDIDN